MSYPKTYNPCDDCQYSYSKNGQESNTCKICEFKQLLDNFKEVKYGEWIKAPCSEKDGDAHCSECNHWDWSDCKYCSSCGAKMDRERKR